MKKQSTYQIELIDDSVSKKYTKVTANSTAKELRRLFGATQEEANAVVREARENGQSNLLLFSGEVIVRYLRKRGEVDEKQRS